MDKIKLRARAKINLSIDIKGILPNGYHEVEMVMQSIELSDYLWIRKTKRDFKMSSSNSILPIDKRNIVYRTWKLMKDRFKIEENVDIFLEKNIPIAAGMAGGSADSAAILVGVNKLFNLGLENEDLREISKELGSDIAFCIDGGASIARGSGTDLESIKGLDRDLNILVCKPNASVSTKRIYDEFDRKSGKNFSRPDNKKIVSALEDNNIDDLTLSMENVLEPITKSKIKDIGYIEDTMRDFGASVSMMSGSGPTVFGLFESRKKTLRCSEKLRKFYSQTHVTSASKKGVEICGNK